MKTPNAVAPTCDTFSVPKNVRSSFSKDVCPAGIFEPPTNRLSAVAPLAVVVYWACAMKTELPNPKSRIASVPVVKAVTSPIYAVVESKTVGVAGALAVVSP